MKDALLAEISATRSFFYKTVVAQAQKIDVTDERVTFTFLPTHKALRAEFEQKRGWIEAAVERLSGRKIPVTAVQSSSDDGPGGGQAAGVKSGATGSGDSGVAPGTTGASDAKQEAMASPAMRDLLDVFPAQIRNVEEL